MIFSGGDGLDMKYFIIESTEDGDIRICEETKVGIVDKLNERINDGEDIRFVESIKDCTDPMYWGRKTLIIKGEIVTPHVVYKVKKFALK